MKKIQKYIVLFMAITILTGILQIPVFAANNITMPAVDEGKKEIYITTAEELAWIASQVSAGNTLEKYTIELMNNIDMSGISWGGIGYNLNNYFAGVFDGNNFTISNFTADGNIDSFNIINTPRHTVGFFGVCSGATVKNLIVENCSLSISNESGYQHSYSSIDGTSIFGAIVCGYAVDSTFNNIIIRNSQVSVYTGAEAGSAYAGGITGYATQCSFAHCINESGNVSGTTQSMNANAYAGGMTGYYLNEGTIRQCSNKANINTGSSMSNGYAGGIVGMSSGNSQTLSSIRDCYNKGQIVHNTSGYMDTAYLGGIIGYSSSAVNRCYNAGNVTASIGMVGSGYLAGISGSGTSSSVVSNSAMMAAKVSGGTAKMIAGAGTKNNNIASTSSTGTNDANKRYAPDEFYDKTLYEDVLLWDFKSIWIAQESDFPELKYVDAKLEEDIIRVEEAANRLQILFQEGTGDSYSRVTQNIAFPESPNEVTVTWSSGNEAVISSTTGEVNRQEQEYQVCVTATILSGSYSVQKKFVLNVLGISETSVEESADWGMSLDSARAFIAMVRGKSFKNIAADDPEVRVLIGVEEDETIIKETLASILQFLQVPGESPWLKSKMGDVIGHLKRGEADVINNMVSDIIGDAMEWEDPFVNWRKNLVNIPLVIYDVSLDYVDTIGNISEEPNYSFNGDIIDQNLDVLGKITKFTDYAADSTGQSGVVNSGGDIISWVTFVYDAFQGYNAWQIEKQNAQKAYFNKYMRNREHFQNPDDEVFKLIMSANVVGSILSKGEVEELNSTAEAMYTIYKKFGGGLSGKYKITISCPVDVFVYDNTGEIVGRVVNNEVDYTIQNSVFITVGGPLNDIKTIYIDDKDKYTITLVGNDTGAMSVEIENNTGNCIKNSFYNDIELMNGKTMSFEFSAEEVENEMLPAIYLIEDGVKTDIEKESDKQAERYRLTIYPYLEDGEGVLSLTTEGGYCQDGYVEKGTVLRSLVVVRDGYDFDDFYSDVDCTQSYNESQMSDSELTLYAKFTPVIYVLQQPVSADYTVGDTPQPLSVLVSGDTEAYTYQWYSYTVDKSDAIPIEAANGMAYEPATDKEGTIYYFVRISCDNDGNTISFDSKSAKIQVGTTVPEIPMYARYTKTYGDAPFSLCFDAVDDGDITYVVCESRDAEGIGVEEDQVITVSNDGIVTIQGAGSAIITVTTTGDVNDNVVSSVNISVLVNQKVCEAQILDKNYNYSVGEVGDFDLSTLLPADRGKTSYVLTSSSAPFLSEQRVSEEGRLTYTVGTNGISGDSTSIIVTASMANYTDVIITVNIKLIDEFVLVPTSNIASGSVVEKGTEIALNCENEGVQIYYTLDGTEPTTDSTLYTEPIVLTEATTIKAMAVKEGCNNSEVAVFTYTIAENEKVTFTVSFNSIGGSKVLRQTVEENQKAKEPEEPVWEGYVFKGWYLRDELYDFNNPVTADIMLEAKWEKKEEEKEILSIPTVNIESGSVVEKGTEIILSCETEGVQIYYTLDKTNPTTDSILYTEPIVLTEATIIKAMAVKEGFNNSEVSVFTYTIAEEETVIFKVTFNSNGGNKVSEQTVEEGQKANKPEDPVYEGYVFEGWYFGDKLYDFENPVTADITLKAKWKKEEIEQETLLSPTANIESGSVVEKGREIILSCETEGVQIYYTLDKTNPTTGSTLYTEPIVLTKATTIKAIAVKEGYNNSEVAVFAYTIAEGETVTFTVTFNSNGGSQVLAQTVGENQKAKEPEEPTRKGYLFKGWYLGDELYDFDNLVTADITLEARWEIDESQKKGDVLPEDIPSDGIIPDGIWSAGINDKIYAASAIKQSFRVYDGTKLLKEKTDYTIFYKNNKNAYTYLDEDYTAFEENLKNTGKKVKTGTFDPAKAPQVTIKMKGNYSGSKTIYFKIEQADISGDGFETADLTVTYTGKKQTPKPTLTWNGKALKYGTDFYVPEYDNAKKDKKAFTEPQSEPYKLTITGKKNFTGEIPITLTISNSTKQIAMNKVTVKGITNQKWNGEQITQSGFKVSYGKDVLTEENGDYTISWGTNKAVGTGTVTFTGTGQDTDDDGFSYIGSKTVSFKITGTAMSKVTVTGVEKSYPFTGTAIKPVASLSYKVNKNADSVPLTEGTHYTVDYKKNVDKGTATIVFTGMESGGYTGTKKYTFKITASGVGDITNGNVVAEQIQVTFKDMENVKDGIYIAPLMKGGSKPEVIVTSGGMTLEHNKDYSISYANNKKPALSTDKNAPSLTVKGKGNFIGSKKVYFTIVPKALTNENGIKVVVNDKIVSDKPNGYRQSFKVYDSDGKALGGADYDAGKAVYTLIETRNEDGTVKEEHRILDKTSTVPANSTIRVTVPGKGNYAGGEAYTTYRILENGHDISKATIQIQDQDYTGNPVLITEQSQFKPGKVYIKIGKENKELVLGEDIQVVPESYVKHVDKGTAKVTFRGINDFGGTKTVSYKIGTRSIEEFWKGIQARMARMFD